jgi:hypothetical protein
MYNVIKLNIQNGLNNQEISLGAGNYLILQYSEVDVKIRINSNFNPEITLKQNSGIEYKDIERIYISCEPYDGDITFLQGDTSDSFHYIPPTFGKLDIGTVDSVKLVENVNFVNLVESVREIQSVLGVGAMTLERLYEEYTCYTGSGATSWYYTDDGIIVDNLILEAQQKIDPYQTVVDWEQFDYIVLNMPILIRGDTTITEDSYATIILSPDFSQGADLNTIICIDYIDNNINTGKQNMLKVLSSKFLKKFSDIGAPLKIHCYNAPSNPLGQAFISCNLYKKMLDQTPIHFNVGSVVITRSNMTANIPMSFVPIDMNFKGFLSGKITFTNNNKERIINLEVVESGIALNKTIQTQLYIFNDNAKKDSYLSITITKDKIYVYVYIEGLSSYEVGIDDIKADITYVS